MPHVRVAYTGIGGRACMCSPRRCCFRFCPISGWQQRAGGGNRSWADSCGLIRTLLCGLTSFPRLGRRKKKKKMSGHSPPKGLDFFSESFQTEIPANGRLKMDHNNNNYNKALAHWTNQSRYNLGMVGDGTGRQFIAPKRRGCFHPAPVRFTAGASWSW